MHLLLLMVLHPGRAARELKSRSPWIVAFLVLSLASVATYALMHAYLLPATLAHLPPGATDADREIIMENLNSELPVNLLFLPVRLFLGWSAFSLVLFLACRSFVPHERIRFRQALSLEVHAEVASVVAGIVTLIVTAFSASGTAAGTPLSLGDMITGSQSFLIKSLLTSLNIFTLWYVVLLTIALSIFCKIGKIRAVLIALAVWAVSTVFHLGAMQLVHDELHFAL